MTTTLTLTPATVKVDRRAWPFTGYPEASTAYLNAISKLGRGVSRTPPCHVVDGAGTVIACVAYNGRVFEVGADGEFTTLIYRPEGDEEMTTTKSTKAAPPVKAKKAAAPAKTKKTTRPAKGTESLSAQKLALAKRPEGVSMDELLEQFGTQPHSLRAALSVESRKQGLVVRLVEGRYKIVEA